MSEPEDPSAPAPSPAGDAARGDEGDLERGHALRLDDESVPPPRRLIVRVPEVPAREYPFLVAEGLLERTGEHLAAWSLRPGPVALVTDVDVGALYGDAVSESLRAHGYEPTLLRVPAGEEHKTLATVATLYAGFSDVGLDRRATVIGLGGGVVLDLAAFAAATYARGVPYVALPTTLLAMIDAGVGGKSGVNLAQGKNLVGLFRAPRGVLADPLALVTLPPEEFAAGLAEVVKHALIGDPALFETLEQVIPDDLDELVVASVQVKVRIVEADPYEEDPNGGRMLLNLGHTFGHGLERASGWALRHGEAVGLGLLAAAHLGAALGRCAPELEERIRSVLEHAQLPTTIPGLDEDAVWAAMAHDKKRRGRKLRFVIPEDVGRAVVVDDPDDALVRAALRRVLA